MESERHLIGCEARSLLQDLFQDLCLIDVDQFVQDHELIRCNLASCLECISSACHMSWEIMNSMFNQPGVCTLAIL
jgi:hypothetical protein